MYSDEVHSVGVLGASGYGGAETLRLLAGHPDLEVVHVAAHSHVGVEVADLYPSLAPAYGGLVFEPIDAAGCDGLDLVVCALPHGASQALVPELHKRVGCIVDLAADFRLKDPSLYPRWYGEAHTCPDLLAEAAFGLPELFRADLPGAALVAAPGCYVTAAALALAPLVRSGAVEPTGVIVDAASGTSGAGRAPKDNLHAAHVDANFTAYGLLTHRHTPEIEQATGAQVLFTPHLAPMARGILATVYARPAGGRATSTSTLLDLYRQTYAGEPFVVVSERSPATKATLGSNSCHLTARFDERTGWVVAIAALDNLVKGAAGQGIQCANLALGLAETAGLPMVGTYP